MLFTSVIIRGQMGHGEFLVFICWCAFEWSQRCFAPSAPLLLLTFFYLLSSASVAFLFPVDTMMVTAGLNVESSWLPVPPSPLWPRCSYFLFLLIPTCYPNPLCNVKQYIYSFISFASKLWNICLLSATPPTYKTNTFKREKQTLSRTTLAFLLCTFLLRLFA